MANFSYDFAHFDALLLSESFLFLLWWEVIALSRRAATTIIERQVCYPHLSPGESGTKNIKTSGLMMS